MTLHVTNWPSKTLHGPGRRWSIMARPRSWERGDGTVGLFVPDEIDLLSLQRGSLDPDEYRTRFLRLVAHRVRRRGLGLLPGALLAGTESVQAGDTLLCACAVAKAREGRCHRVWAAAFLTVAGWPVLLDGESLDPVRALEWLRP